MLSKPEKISKIKQWLNQTKLDPAIVKQNLGVESDKISAQVLLAASEKLIRINKKTDEPDDRDHLKFSKFMGLEDFIEEHVARDAGRIQQKAAFKMQTKKNLSWLTPGFFSPQIRSVIIGNSLAQNVDGINPMEHWDNSHRVTKMGPGGIPSSDAIPPECYDVDTQVFTDKGWIYWSETTMTTKFACNINGILEFHYPYRLIKERYTGKMYGIKNHTLDILVTPNHRMWCRKYRNSSSVKRCGLADWQFLTMDKIYQKPREFMITHSPSEGSIPFNDDMAELESYYITDYDNYVYCAQVPGELLLVSRKNSVPVWSGNSRNVAPSSFGFFDPVHVMETEKIGVTNFISQNVGKGKDGKLWRIMKTKDGLKWMDHEDILNKQVKIPEY